jgi:hypothetical protein
MNAPLRSEERLFDLLVLEATQGLSAVEEHELQELKREFPHAANVDIERTVAALTVALLAGRDMPPQALRDRIVAAGRAAAATKSQTPRASVSNLQDARSTRSASGVSASNRFSRAGWWVAAASLLLALAGWWPRLTGNPSALVANTSPTQAREELLSSGRAIRASWTPPSSDGGQALVGDVVFDPVTQRGFLSFRGIPANDPRLAQYQLWIVDARRKQPEPVDGGIFDVAAQPPTAASSSSGEVVIPFEARLPVGQPAAFVVTLEQPGGVVISKQEKVLALAKVGPT